MGRDWIATSSCFIRFGCALGIVLAGIPVQSTAQESNEAGGHITIRRSVPQHDAFRVGERGDPTNIATAREDLVVSAVTATHGVPQSMSDAMLNDMGVAGRPTSGSRPSDQSAGAVGAVASAGLLKPTGGSAPQSGSNLLQMPSAGASMGGAGLGATIGHSMSALGSVMSAMPGAK